MPVGSPGGPNPRAGFEDASETIELDAALLGSPESFTLSIEVEGWEKEIPLPPFASKPDHFIFAAPDLKVTLTNMESGASYTTSISGVTHREVQADGTIVETYTGRHLNFDPEMGFVIISGRFTATYEANGDELGDVIEPLSGDGQVIDVWDVLL